MKRALAMIPLAMALVAGVVAPIDAGPICFDSTEAVAPQQLIYEISVIGQSDNTGFRFAAHQFTAAGVRLFCPLDVPCQETPLP